MRSLVSSACLVAAVTACGKTPRPLSIDITTGQETDAFTAAPAVTRVDVTVSFLDKSPAVTASAPPGGTFDLGTVTDTEQISISVDGFDKAGAPVMHGLSLGGLPLSGISGTSVPVFIQRSLAWARPPGGLREAHVGGVAGFIGERYVTVTGGAKAAGDTSATKPTQVDAYDLLALDGAVSQALPRAPQSLVPVGSSQLLIDAAGATWVDFSGASAPVEAALPAGLAWSFGEVAGGATVYDATGMRTFVVGGTRRGAATTAVLEVSDDRTLPLVGYTLLTPRKGAAATYVDAIGLVVAGGSADPAGAGVEVLAVGAKVFSALGYPADPVEGAGAVTDGAHGIGLLGGTSGGMAAPTRLLDASCGMGKGCVVTAAGGATLPLPTTGVAAFRYVGTRSIVVAQEAGGAGMTRTFLVDLSNGGTLGELPLKEPRRGATPVPTPLGTLALLGGEHPDGTPATSIECFSPPPPP